MKIYIIDANIFMQAARSYYSFDIAQRFWDSLVDYANDGKLISVDKVFQEIKAGREDDPLLLWSKDYFIEYFDTTQIAPIVQAYADLICWAGNSDYSQAAKDEFMEDDNADAWIIAYAKANNGIVVTFEKTSSKKSKIPIPHVCDEFQIEYCDTFEMLESLKFTF